MTTQGLHNPPLNADAHAASEAPQRRRPIERIKPINAGGVILDPVTALAPMEGITDREFRMLIRGFGGCGLTVTEFISSELLSRQDRHAWAMMELDPQEHPVSIQIYGRRPEAMADAARYCEDQGADLIDLNLGCPSKQVTSGSSGSALMKEPALAARIFAAVQAAVSVPMTVKMRLGWDDDRRNAPEIARLAEQEGAVMVAVHGRTREQMYSGHADWAAIADVVDAVDVPVLLNGDILTPDDAVEALRVSRAHGVMVGRGAMRDPWILRRISDVLDGREPYQPTLQARRETLLRYFALLEAAARTDKRAMGRMKKVTTYFTRELPYGLEVRKRIHRSHDIPSITQAVHDYFDRLEDESLSF